MSASYALSTVQVTGSNLNITYVVLAVALGALAIAYALRQQVLAASEGTA
jgi:K(+)-stimulated pyrophosphate-energized sodium pump